MFSRDKQHINISFFLHAKQTVTDQDIQSWKSYHRSNHKSNTISERLPQERQYCRDNGTVSSQQERNDDFAQNSDNDDDGSGQCGSNQQNPAVLCPICIHDIEVGNKAVVLTSCQHVFHKVSEIEWIKVHHCVLVGGKEARSQVQCDDRIILLLEINKRRPNVCPYFGFHRSF